jgi:heterodisulfide reductase subunit B
LAGIEISKVLYYPGCTLYEKARHLDRTARESTKLLGIELIELSSWTCCGAAFPLATDNKMGLLAPTRILATAAKEDPNKPDRKDNKASMAARPGSEDQKPETSEVYLTTLCAFCYNVLKRTNNLLCDDDYKLRKINEFLEENYQLNVTVKHLLEILRDDYGFDRLKDNVRQPLTDLKVVPYYGCQLLRPAKEMQIDDPEQPTILENFLSSIGSTVVDFPFKNECCGSYQMMDNEEIALELSYRILNNAMKNGAEAVALSCPVCYYNLDKKQEQIKERFSGFGGIPVFYFTELLALAMDLDIELLELHKHYVDPVPLLKKKNLIRKSKKITTHNGSEEIVNKNKISEKIKNERA